MTAHCETWSIADGHCTETATTRLVQTAAGVNSVACDRHAAGWLRTKKVRGVVVRVFPAIVAYPVDFDPTAVR